MMFRYQFFVNRVSDKGLHERQEGKVVTVDAPNEEIARSMARAKLRDWSPGVQRFHPADLMNPPAAIPVAPEAAVVKAKETASKVQ